MQIFRRSDDIAHALSDALRDQARILQFAKADGDVDIFGDQIEEHELRLIVPLADSTIYEMEKRGEFPRRFNLTPRCVVWDLEEVERWLEQRRQTYLARENRA